MHYIDSTSRYVGEVLDAGFTQRRNVRGDCAKVSVLAFGSGSRQASFWCTVRTYQLAFPACSRHDSPRTVCRCVSLQLTEVFVGF